MLPTELGALGMLPNRTGAERSWARRLPLAVGTLLVAGILLGSSWPASAMGTASVAPPFRGTHVVVTPTTLSQGPCRASERVGGPFWNATSGAVDGVAFARVHTCAPRPIGPAQIYASAAVDITVAIPVRVTSGPHNISLAVSFDLTVTTATSGPLVCPARPHPPGQSSQRSCFLEEAATTGWSFVLFDATNQTRLGGSLTGAQGPTTDYDQQNTTRCSTTGHCSTTGASQNCSSIYSAYGHCVRSGSPSSGANTTWLNTSRNCYNAYGRYCFGWENWTLNASHHYWILVTFTSYSWVNDYNYAPGSALVASIAPGGSSVGMWRITSLTVR